MNSMLMLNRLLRPTIPSVSRSVRKATLSRGFMNTGSFPVISDPSLAPPTTTAFENMKRMDHSHLWKAGFFPKETDEYFHSKDGDDDKSLTLFDTHGMLSALPYPVEGYAVALNVIHNIQQDEEVHAVKNIMYADSVLKKRRKKMNKHKLKKRRKLLRMKTKKT